MLADSMRQAKHITVGILTIMCTIVPAMAHAHTPEEEQTELEIHKQAIQTELAARARTKQAQQELEETIDPWENSKAARQKIKQDTAQTQDATPPEIEVEIEAAILRQQDENLKHQHQEIDAYNAILAEQHAPPARPVRMQARYPGSSIAAAAHNIAGQVSSDRSDAFTRTRLSDRMKLQAGRGAAGTTSSRVAGLSIDYHSIRQGYVRRRAPVKKASINSALQFIIPASSQGTLCSERYKPLFEQHRKPLTTLSTASNASARPLLVRAPEVDLRREIFR